MGVEYNGIYRDEKWRKELAKTMTRVVAYLVIVLKVLAQMQVALSGHRVTLTLSLDLSTPQQAEVVRSALDTLAMVGRMLLGFITATTTQPSTADHRKTSTNSSQSGSSSTADCP